MKLWLLCSRDTVPAKDNPWEVVWDCAEGFVVSAESENDARKLAQEQGGDETNFHRPNFDKSFPAWLDEKYSTCVELEPVTPARVILRDFNAG